MPVSWSPSKPCVEDVPHLDATTLAHAEVLVPDRPDPTSFVWAWSDLDDPENDDYADPRRHPLDRPSYHPFRAYRSSKVLAHCRCRQSGYRLSPPYQHPRGSRNTRIVPDYSRLVPSAKVGIEVQTSSAAGTLTITYRVTTQQRARPAESRTVRQTVSASTTRPNFGSLRWWLHCPLCERRAAKLFLPIAPTIHSCVPRFGCRRCWSLTYVSAQQAHKWERSDRVMARLFASLS